MLTERFRRVVDRAAQLPPDTQDALAHALEEALDIAVTRSDTVATSDAGGTPNRSASVPTSAPPLDPELRAAFERVIQRHAASLAYLKDR